MLVNILSRATADKQPDHATQPEFRSWENRFKQDHVMLRGAAGVRSPLDELYSWGQGLQSRNPSPLPYYPQA